MKMTNLFKSSVIAAILVLGMSKAQAALIFAENFENGLGAWNQDGSWSTISFNGSMIAENAPGVTGDSLIRSFTATSATSFQLDFDFGWLYGPAPVITLGVALLDSTSDSGYMYTIRMGGAGYTYELETVVNGIVVTSGNYAGTGSYDSNVPLVSGSFTWDGTTLAGWAGGVNQVSMTNTAYSVFDSVVLINYNSGGGAQSRFDNISLNVVPEPASALYLGFALAGGALLLRRKTAA